MPNLAVYFGASVVYFLLEKDDKSLEFFNFPYVYSPKILSNQCNDSEFYGSLIENVLKSYKLTPKSCSIIVSGFLKIPVLPFETSLSVDLINLLQNINNANVLIVNNYSLVSKDFLNSYDFCQNFTQESDYRANLSIYPQIVPTDISTQTEVDKNILCHMEKDTVFPQKGSNLPVVFCESRFLGYSSQKELDYALMLDLINQPGIFSIYRDKDCASILLTLLKMSKNNFEFDLFDYLEFCGVLAKTYGDADCLMESEYEDKRFVSVPKDSVFITPVSSDIFTKIFLKSQTLGKIEKTFKGGTVGLIIDTRTTNKPLYENAILTESVIKDLSRALWFLGMEE